MHAQGASSLVFRAPERDDARKPSSALPWRLDVKSPRQPLSRINNLAMPRGANRRRLELLLVLSIQLLALVAYVVISGVFFYLAGNAFTLEGSGWPWLAELAVAAWLLFVGGFVWLLVLAVVIRWLPFRASAATSYRPPDELC